MQLIELSQSEVAPYCWELSILCSRILPITDGQLILTLVIIETTEIIIGLATQSSICPTLESAQSCLQGK